MGKSKELKVMARYWDQLVPVIRNNLKEVSLFLYNKSIICKQTCREVVVNTSVFGREERAIRVLRELEDKIEEDDDNYYVFVCFLSSKSELSKLVKSLSAAFCELGGKVEDYNRRVCNIEERKKSVIHESSSGKTGSHQRRELTLVNIRTFLRDHNFPAAHADKLGEQLDGVTRGDIMTYKKKHNGDDWNGILTDIIVHWLKHDWKRSWEKLARALSACNHKAIAAKIRKGEPLDSGTSTASVEKEKEPHTQRNVTRDHILRTQYILIIIMSMVVVEICVLLQMTINLHNTLAYIPNLASTGMSMAIHQKHTSTPDEGQTQNAGKGGGIKYSSAKTDFSDVKKILYQNNYMTWKCEEHNFSMTFQPGSLPTGIHESLLEISVTSGEEYVLPVQTVPVSMFFSIKHKHKFYRNVLVSIEHISAETSDLSFVVSSNPQPPFQFELLSGGDFDTKRHGKIERSEFSTLGIVTRIQTGRWPPMWYYCALYTSPPVDYTWTVYIYILKDFTNYKHRIEEDTKYSERALNTYTVATVDDAVDYFTLDISLKDEEISQGWQLPPEIINPIRISRGRIDSCHGIPIPANFKIIMDGSKNKNSFKFNHGYIIADVVQENTLSLILSPQVLPAIQESARSVIDSSYTCTAKSDCTDCTTIESAKKLENVLKEVSTVPYDKMCRDLNITSATCNGMETKNPFILSQKYLEQHPEPCWENVIKMLCNDFEHYKLAKGVKDEYGVPEQVYKEHCTRK